MKYENSPVACGVRCTESCPSQQRRPPMHALLVGMSAVGMPHSGQLSIATWNLLAPCFTKPSKYPWASPESLTWPRRQEKIVARLAAVDADAVCLQEVEVALWDGLHERMRALGYEGILQETRGHPVANAVLLRRGTLQLERVESRSRALITVVRARPDAPPLYLASVHLEAGAEKAATRLAQCVMGSIPRKRLAAPDLAMCGLTHHSAASHAGCARSCGVSSSSARSMWQQLRAGRAHGFPTLTPRMPLSSLQATWVPPSLGRAPLPATHHHPAHSLSPLCPTTQCRLPHSHRIPRERITRARSLLYWRHPQPCAVSSTSIEGLSCMASSPMACCLRGRRSLS